MSPAPLRPALAAALFGVVTPWVLAGCGSGPGDTTLVAGSAVPSSPPVSVSSSVAPSTAFLSSSASVPSTSVFSPSAAPSSPASASPGSGNDCTASSLALKNTAAAEGPGHAFVVGFALTNTGTSSCVVSGYPALQISEPSGARVPIHVHDVANTAWYHMPTGAVALAPGQAAGFWIVYVYGTDKPSCDYAYSIVRVVPPNTTTALTYSENGNDHSAFVMCADTPIYESPVHAGTSLPTSTNG